MAVSGQHQNPAAIIPGNDTGTHWIEGSVGHRIGLGALHNSLISCWGRDSSTGSSILDYPGFTIIVIKLTVITVHKNSDSFYTGYPRRNGQNFGRVFLMLKYTDVTQNTYIQSWTVTEIMAREVWNFDVCYSLIDYQIHIETGRNMWFL